MSAPDYDLVTIGGGLGGAALAKVMAEAGARVLVLEQEPNSGTAYGANSSPRGAWQRRSNLPLQICFGDAGATRPPLRWDWGSLATCGVLPRRVYPPSDSAIRKCRKFCFRLLPALARTCGAKWLSLPSSQDILREYKFKPQAVIQARFRAALLLLPTGGIRPSAVRHDLS